MWSSFHGADMYGAIENSQMVPHLQSFFVAWDLNSRTRPFLNDFWNDFRYVVHKSTLIWRYEIRFIQAPLVKQGSASNRSFPLPPSKQTYGAHRRTCGPAAVRAK